MNKLLLVLVLFPLLGCNQGSESKKIETFNTQSDTKSVNYSNIIKVKYNQQNLIGEQSQKTNPKQSMKEKVILNVPLEKQNPELKYGCEVTSLSMVLRYAGVKVNKMELYRKVIKDPDPIVRTKNGDILKWGNPKDGYVGDMTGKKAGYAVYDQPIEHLVNQYLPDRAVNLTNKKFNDVLAHVSKGFPVVVWTTGDYHLPDRPESWKHGNETIVTPLDLHVVTLVGYDQSNVYLNDPLSGKKQVKVSKERFISSWKALKKRAVSYQ